MGLDAEQAKARMLEGPVRITGDTVISSESAMPDNVGWLSYVDTKNQVCRVSTGSGTAMVELSRLENYELPQAKRPVVFLDVDGVIATFVDPDNDFSDPAVKWAEHHAVGIRHNPQISRWIRELSIVADIRWLTSWHGTAATELAPALGLPDFEVVDFRSYEYKPHPDWENADWKFRAVLEQLEAGDRPVLWIDDEIGYDKEYDYLRGLARDTGSPFFAVRPTLENGLTEGHMTRIRDFIRANT